MVKCRKVKAETILPDAEREVCVMSLERAKAYLKEYKMEDQIREFPVSSATVELAAEALHTEAGRIAKTLSFLVDGEAVLIVCAGDARIDNAKYKAFFHAKAKMLAPDEVEERIGHAIGGVCPFGIKEGVRVYLDETLKKYETVFPACGSSNSAIELTIPQLEQLAKPVCWVDVCKLPAYKPVFSRKSLHFP